MTIRRFSFAAALGLGLAAALGVQAQPAAGTPALAIKVANQTKQAVVAVYTSLPGRGDWGDDMLGKGKLAPGKTLNLKLIGPAGECMLDFSALLENGDTVVQKAVDVCQAAPQVQF
jgi:hypothetical protein